MQTNLTERAQYQADQIQKQLFARSKERQLGRREPKPIDYRWPQYNTPNYWQDVSRGWISEEEQQRDHAQFEVKRKRGLASRNRQAKPASRHNRPAPVESKQFAKAMATQAARDDRLTPQSKSLLQIIVARTGRGRSTDTTKTTLAKIMSRCPRSIQRYIQELIKFGYIRTQTIKSRRTGFYVGMRIWIMNSVLPFFAGGSDKYEAKEWEDVTNIGRNREETEKSPTNNKNRLRRALMPDKPPWFAEIAFR